MVLVGFLSFGAVENILMAFFLFLIFSFSHRVFLNEQRDNTI